MQTGQHEREMLACDKNEESSRENVHFDFPTFSFEFLFLIYLIFFHSSIFKKKKNAICAYRIG